MEKKGYNVLTTPYEEKMSAELPFGDYPRPSLVRESYISLNGKWDFAVSGEEYPEVYGEKILVPFPPESRLSGVFREIPEGSVLYYRRTFTLPEGEWGDRLLLHFGAVDQICEVRVNGRVAAEHEGGYLPFSADITELVTKGENTLEVRAVDDLSHDYPYGKQRRRRGGMWYTPVSGIWQSVWLEFVPDSYIERLIITSDTECAHIEVVGGKESKKLTLSDGTVYEWQGACIDIRPESPRLWSPEEPYLYEFTLESGEDRVSSYFALREISIREVLGVPRLLLNGKPYLFNGLLDQGYYPDGIFLPATAEGYYDDIMLTKSLGFNTLRKHIKIEPDIFYYLCDKLGVCVFQDMVNNSGYSFLLDTALPTVGLKSMPDGMRHRSKRSRSIFQKHSLAIVDYLRSHPSVLYYTVFNEGWGQFNADENYRLIKAQDPTRIIDATSGWFVRRESDVDSRHVYFKPVKVKKPSDRPIVISEFGGYSLRCEGHLFGEGNYGYKLYESEEQFENDLIKLYSEEIKPLIKRGVSGLIYTQVSDIEDETNGVITYDRRHIKLHAERVREVMESLYREIDFCSEEDS